MSTEISSELKKPIEGGQTSTRPTERLLQSRGGAVLCTVGRCKYVFSVFGHRHAAY